MLRSNKVDDYVVQQNSGLKVDDLRSVNGKKLFQNNQFLVHTHSHKHTHTHA